MKFRLTFKTPDVLEQLRDQLPDPEAEMAFRRLADKYVKFAEYVTLEFDTITQSAKVVRA